MLKRRGVTLVELLVSLVLAAIVLGAATSSALRQQRTHARIGGVVASEGQLRSATRLLSGQLAFVDVAAGDLVSGEAQDTALQLRATVAFALACDSATGRATFLPDGSESVALSGMASLPRVGDSLWFLADSSWRGARITSVSSSSATCAAPFSATGPAYRLTFSGLADTIPAGAPLRVTRPVRYAFYRGGDGTWQLGFREWNEGTASFSAPQPVAGPFLRGSDERRSRFRYFGAAGEELTGEGFERAVARIRVVAHSLAIVRERGQDSVRSDSVDVAVQRAIVR